MNRPSRILLPLFAALLAPRGAWEATSPSQNIPITITQATQSVSFNPPSLTFASQSMGTTSAAQTITMTNTGTVSFPLSSIAVTGTDSGDFSQTNDCPTSLAVNTGCQISVTFAPMATGTRTASVVASAAGGGTYTALLSGTGKSGTSIVPAFYVATNGSDRNAGTATAPFATLSKCQTAMQGSSTIKTCYIRAGTYTLPSTGLVLTNADNGETWSYYPPDGAQSPVLSGASLAASTPAVNSTARSITINGLSFINNVNGYIAVLANQGNNDNTSFINNLVDGGNNAGLYLIDITGNNMLIAGNTFQNWGNSSEGDAIWLYEVTNSVIKNNTVQCVAQYGIIDANGSTGNLIYGNQFVGLGAVGGPAPTCGSSVGGGGGAAVDLMSDSGNLLHDNTTTGYQLGYAFVLNGTSGANYIQANTLETPGNPVITLNGGPSTVIRKNAILSTGSVGFNLGDEHDACPRSGASNNLLVTNNNINSAYEPLYLTATQNSIIQGNTGNIGTQTVGNPSPHWPAGVSIPNWAADAGCLVVENSKNNTIQLNSFTSSNAAAKYGVYFENSQTGNTLAYNILYPYGSPGTAAVQNNSGGLETLTNNQTTSSTTPLNNAPPIADAGAGAVVGPGQAVVLDGSATHLMMGGTSSVGYAWTQISGPSVTISNASSVQASFTAPIDVTQAAILGFRLVATTVGGSTYDEVYYGVDPSL